MDWPVCARTCTPLQRILYRAWIMYPVGADSVDQHLGGFDQYWYTLSMSSISSSFPPSLSLSCFPPPPPLSLCLSSSTCYASFKCVSHPLARSRIALFATTFSRPLGRPLFIFFTSFVIFKRAAYICLRGEHVKVTGALVVWVALVRQLHQLPRITSFR